MKQNKTKLALLAKLVGGLCLLALLVFNLSAVVSNDNTSELSLSSLMNSAQAQGEGGGGDTLWHKSTRDCNFTIHGEGNAKFKLYGTTYTIPISGSITLSFNDVSTDCSSGGTFQCSSFSCANFWAAG